MAGLLVGLRRQMAENRRRSLYGSDASLKGEKRAARVMPSGSKIQADQKESGQKDADQTSGDLHAGEETADKQRGSTCERTRDIVSRDDFLLQQIDEFRDRARQLQELMSCREEQVRQLEQAREAEQARQLEQARQMRQMSPTAPAAAACVPEQESSVRGDVMQRLEHILQERQERTEDLTAEVERKIDEMIASVGAKLSELDASVRESVDGEQKISEQRARELKESLEQIQEQLVSLKADLSDKVHSENVKCYRNIQELLKNMEQKLDEIQALNARTASTRSFAIAAMVFAVLNFVAVLGVLVVQSGIFGI